MDKVRVRAYGQMHLAILLWGFTAIFGQLIKLDEGLLVWYRMGITAVAMALYLLIKRSRLKMSRKTLVWAAFTGLVITLHWITFYGAIKASNVSVAISCFSSLALFTAILDPLSRGQRIKMPDILLSLAVMTGIVLIFLNQKLYIRGIVLSIISAFLASVFTILNKRIGEGQDSAGLTFVELGTGFLLLSLGLPLWFSLNESEFLLPAATDWIYLILLALACTAFAFTLSLEALKILDPFTMNLSVNLEPLYSIVLAIVILHEDKELNRFFYFGSLIIFSSVAIHAWLQFRKYRRLKKDPHQ